MIDPARFLAVCREQGVDFYTGVPDSLLKQLNTEILSLPRDRHVIAANEGAAVGMAIGHYLRTGAPAAVYLQNSGFGNLVNPLLSLADPDVYGIPMLIIVGWRGQPGVPDEPQHVKQGRIMAPLLDAMELPWSVLPREPAEAERCVKDAVTTAVERSSPYLLLVEKGTFGPAAGPEPANPPDLPSREEALVALLAAIGDGVVIVSTTGMLSRELFEHRARGGGSGERDFLTVGGMGHASSIALGIAFREPDREVWCLDGDGALLMHAGSLAVIADHAPAGYFHVVFNNGVHDSVGGQPTSISAVDVPAAAQAMGYRYASRGKLSTLNDEVAALREHGGPSLLELRVRPGNRPDLGRPTRTPADSKHAFMTAITRVPAAPANEGSPTPPGSPGGPVKRNVRYGSGAIAGVPALVASLGTRRVLLVCGARSFEASGAAAMVPALRQVADLRRWSDFAPNPDLTELARGLAIVEESQPELVLGVGGGTALDLAKLLCAFHGITNVSKLEHAIRSGGPVGRELRLVLAPTTSGSGSEATHFAVVYIGEEKFSVAGEPLRPDVAILDPALSRSGSAYQRASCGIDAVAQAIESLWAVGATPASQAWARHALRLLLPAIERFVTAPDDRCARAMAIGSHLAGRAIDLTRTTAAHALSYAITKRYRVSHGHAVGLTLAGFIEAHASPRRLRDGVDPVAHERAMAEVLHRLGAVDGAGGRIRFRALLDRLGLDRPTVDSEIVRTVNLERLGNNPMPFDEAELAAIVERELP